MDRDGFPGVAAFVLREQLVLDMGFHVLRLAPERKHLLVGDWIREGGKDVAESEPSFLDRHPVLAVHYPFHGLHLWRGQVCDLDAAVIGVVDGSLSGANSHRFHGFGLQCSVSLSGPP